MFLHFYLTLPNFRNQSLWTYQTETMQFQSFKWLLEFVFYVTKIPGYLFVSINFQPEKLEVVRSSWNYPIFITSILLTFLSNAFIEHISIAFVTKSKIMELGVNITIKMIVFNLSIIKITCMLQGRNFSNVLLSLQDGDVKVKFQFIVKLTFN